MDRKQINSCSYNHGILCRIVGRINNTFKMKTTEKVRKTVRFG